MLNPILANSVAILSKLLLIFCMRRQWHQNESQHVTVYNSQKHVPTKYDLLTAVAQMCKLRTVMAPK